MRTTLVGGRALTPNGFEADLCVTVQGERIVAVGGPPEGEIVDLGGSLLVPGFVDLQVNGGGDVLLNDSPDAATMARIADAHLCFGTTSLLPTLISDRLDKAASACTSKGPSSVRRARECTTLMSSGPWIQRRSPWSPPCGAGE
jgi:N-acetylglucosamine-6-phosphate deacetylase